MTSDHDKTHAHIPPNSGTVISHHRIIEPIGAGGMGEVYRAVEPKLNACVRRSTAARRLSAWPKRPPYRTIRRLTPFMPPVSPGRDLRPRAK